jgi:hypothetical protein
LSEPTSNTPSPTVPSLPSPEESPDLFAENPITDLFSNSVDSEEKRKISLEQRGIALVASAGTLATVLFAFAGLLSKAATTTTAKSTGTAIFTKTSSVSAFGPGEKHLLVLVLIGFAAAAFCGLIVNWPRGATAIDPKKLDRYLEPSSFFASVHAAKRQIAIYLRDVVKANQNVNKAKAYWLATGVSIEVLSIMALASLVGWVY